jgi:Cthe_2314-like HEPN
VGASDTPPIAGSKKPDESVVGAYFGRLAELLDRATNPRDIARAFARQMGSRRFMSALETMAEMDRLYQEMCVALDEFTGRGYFLVTLLTVEHLAAVMKLYVISWHTMLDLVARLVNAVLDLGVADRDISLRLVLNNDHVRATQIPKLMAAYEAAVSISQLRKQRNDVVHRGKIPDADLDRLLKDRNSLDSRRHSPLTLSPISEEEYQKRRSELQSQLGTLAKEKHELWREVHQQTVAMTSAVAGELAVRMVERYGRDAIGQQAGAARRDAGRSA